MADEPKTPTNPQAEAPASQAGSATSAAAEPTPAPPADTAGTTPASGQSPAAETASTDGAAPSAGKVGGQGDEGTTLQVADEAAKKPAAAKGRSSLTSIYRRADITTTLVTLGCTLVIGALVLVGYFYVTRTKPAAAPKVSTLDKAELDKLGAFFEGNSAGSDGQVLSIAASSVFKNRVAVASDLKVTGGTQISGTTALGDLTVDKVSTLSVTNVRAALGVAGPASFQGPVQLAGGGAVTGNLAVSGNGSFGGSVSAGVVNTRDLTVSGTLNLAGHISFAGQNPGIAPGQAAGSGASTGVEGNDSSGSVTINTGTIGSSIGPGGGLLATITFRVAYPRSPHIVISPVGQNGAALQYYVLKTATGFTIGATGAVASNTSYAFDYWVVQ